MGAADYTNPTPSPQRMTAIKIMFELQVEQHHHDEKYHREIARLSMHQRLNHMALHFAKYTGRVAATRETRALVAIYVDMLIIALSTANILNVELWEFLEREGREFPGLLPFGRSLALQMSAEMADHAELVQATAVASGRMAAACEKIDHIEELPFRSEITQAIAQLGALSLAFISSNGLDPTLAVRERLNAVKQRLKLHGRV